jgi:hypothetical protein
MGFAAWIMIDILVAFWHSCDVCSTVSPAADRPLNVQVA